MIRTSTLFVLLVGIALPALAQTLTADTSIPAVGHSELRTYHSQFNAPAWAVTGTGNVWDATGVQPFGLSTQVTYHAPGDSPYAASYPATTLCDERISGGDPAEWRHYIVDADHAEMIGVSAEAVSGGRTWCTFPFSLGSSFTDDWILNGNTFSETNTYVASGEIQTPWGTIPDVVMFESAGGFSYYLFEASNLLDPVGTYIPGVSTDVWRVESANGLAETAPLGVALWPNPATDQLVLSLPGQHGFTYTVLAADGCAVLQGNALGDRTVLDLRACAAGLYSVVATDARGRRAVSPVAVVK